MKRGWDNVNTTVFTHYMVVLIIAVNMLIYNIHCTVQMPYGYIHLYHRLQRNPLVVIGSTLVFIQVSSILSLCVGDIVRIILQYIIYIYIFASIHAMHQCTY